MKSDKQVLEEIDHLEMMKRPHLWPRWPVLPIKRWHDDTRVMDFAILLEDEGNSVLFHFNASLYQRPGEWGVGVSRTPESVVADGWVVD